MNKFTIFCVISLLFLLLTIDVSSFGKDKEIQSVHTVVSKEVLGRHVYLVRLEGKSSATEVSKGLYESLEEGDRLAKMVLEGTYTSIKYPAGYAKVVN